MTDPSKPDASDEAPAPSEPEAAPATVELVESGEDVGRLPLPRKSRGESFGIASRLLGAARIQVMCDDSISRMGRITGKMKKKMWIREGDLLVVRPWGFQEGKADIIFRYSRTQAQYLSRRKLLPASMDLFGAPDAPPSDSVPPTAT
ncbi:MAG TPA: translation initiation factor eIF-1A [Thermoplasmata archaeon]|nr:translation initiation factor eIF-1A [Thermoplasmata archaeon]